MNQHYRVRVKTDHREIEVESTEKAFVEEKLESLSKQLNILSVSKGQEILASTKRESLHEFLGRIKPKGATEHTVAIAYFLEKMEGLTEIAVKDIKEGFRRVKFPHSNPSQALSDAKTQRFLMDGSTPKHYVVTGTGEKWIQSKLSGNGSSDSE